MATTVYRPCYCTREDVRRAMELRMADYDDDRIDRAIIAGTEAVEGLTQRKFYPEDATKKFDWPNFQYVPPWKIYFNHCELASQPTAVTTGSFLNSPVTITSGQYILQPYNDGPPYNRMELRRDLSAAFGSNPTPQLDISITGTWGYWMKTHSAGTVAAKQEAIDTTITVSDSGHLGVGDVLICGSERMIITDAGYTDTTETFSGLNEARASDKVVGVDDGTAFSVGEVIRVDTEWLLIEDIVGDTLVVRRGWGGSVLAEHHSGTIWARRVFSVLRGQLGTTAAVHLAAAALTVSVVPGLIKELAIAEASVWLVQEHGAYGGASAANAGAGREPVAGPGLPDLRDRVCNSRFARKARTRVI